MTLLVLFVFGAVVIGAGAMLSPAWPTKQPRIGLASALSLAIIIGGSVFYAALFGWDILVIDYLLFALVVGIFLGGTLSVGQMRAEKQGEVLRDADQGWPGPHDLAFLGLVALIFVTPVFLMPVPLDTEAQTYGYMALATRDGGTFDTFSPFHPEIDYLYPPGFNTITAYLSQQLDQGLHTVQFSVGAILGVVNIWLAYNFGAEIQDKRLGRMMAVTMLASLGVFSAFINGQYTALLGLIFAQALFVYSLRYLRYRYPMDAIAAGLMLGASLLANSGILIIALAGYIPWMGTLWLGQPRPAMRTWLILLLGVPAVALVGLSPWLTDILPLLDKGASVIFERSPDNLWTLLRYHGFWVWPVALLGIWTGWQRRETAVILSVGWLLIVLDFSTTGGIATLLPKNNQLFDPANVARFGPIIPLSILGGMGLLWIWDTFIGPREERLSNNWHYVVCGAAAVIVGVIALAYQPLVRLSHDWFPANDAYATPADEAAMLWIKDNSEPYVRILNFPLGPEADWTVTIAERDTVYLPYMPYAWNNEDVLDEQERLAAFWENPTADGNEALLREAGIDYIIVPQIITAPDDDSILWRWSNAPEWPSGTRDALDQLDYLEKVFEKDGALVYALKER